ncbi:uracil-DNA glycosylase-like [Littorina saxatilis]|uniref:Uracil-DNA glycosylase n=1 Tax=Littorina saxatilis TaxID=31220 RepID=A0AAN9BSH5_9CAEN
MPPKRKRTAKAASKAAAPAKKLKTNKKEAKSKAAPKSNSIPKVVAGVGSKFFLSGLLHDSEWSSALELEMQKDYFISLEGLLASGYRPSGSKTFPPEDLIFNAFNLTPLKQVKVMILGQDPYHDDGQAHGLAFSVPEGIKVPPSLKNMYKELEGDIKGFKVPDHGCLEKWAKEGVLLLNATLTVGAHKPNSHKSYGWQTFTDEVIQVVNAQCQKVVFLLWGNFAHKKEKLIDLGKHSVLKDAHPSPLSFGKFHNCKCFSRANEELKKAGLAPVDWML